MNIQNWKEHSKVLELKAKLEDRKIRGILKWIFQIVVTLVFAAVVALMLFQTVTMQENSMEPTISVGDRFFINKAVYKFSSPERGDLIVFRTNASDDAALHIRRVIGLPGETVQIMDDGSIYINGEKLEENYGMEVIKPETIGRAAEPIELGDDEYFVMGDNRNNSSDSRTDMVGNITRENIIGKAWLRIWPVSDFGVLQHQ